MFWVGQYPNSEEEVRDGVWGCVGGFLVTLYSKRHFCPAKLPIALSYSEQRVSYTVPVQKYRWSVRNEVTVLHQGWWLLNLWSCDRLKPEEIKATTQENEVWLSISDFPRL